jgi:fluoride exporter
MVKLKMELIILVALGGALGAVLRYLMGMGVAELLPYPFPLGILLINILGSFLIGLLFFVFNDQNWQELFRAFVVVGVLGGFTTFSAFSFETLGLLNNGRYAAALLYVLLSVGLGLAAAMLGVKLLRLG